MDTISMLIKTVTMILPEQYAEPIKLLADGFEKLQSIAPPEKMEAFTKAAGDLLHDLNPRVMKYERPDPKTKQPRTYVAIIFEQPMEQGKQ